MAYSKEEKDAFNARCKQNYHQYNNRIQELEKTAKDSNDSIKIIRAVQQIQKELASKNPQGRPEVDLFGKGPGSTRDQFFKRLNTLFDQTNTRNKQDIREQIKRLKEEDGQTETKEKLQQLKDLNQQWICVPGRDQEKKALKTEIDALFSRVKSGPVSQASVPELDADLQAITSDLKQAKSKIQNLKSCGRNNSDYFSNIKQLKDVHDVLKSIFKKIQDGQKKSKNQQLSAPVFQTYSREFQKRFQEMQRLWGHRTMVDLSNWVERTSSSNFQSFDSSLQEIEAGVQQVKDKGQVHSFNQSIKSLESELKQKEGGHPKYPMKRDQLQDLFARAWSCKQFLQDIWEGVTQRTIREYDDLKSELEKIVTLKDKAQSRNDLEETKNQIKKFHALRKEKLQRRALSPKQNYKLRREADTLWDEVTALVEVIAPKQFSYEWLSQAYFTNRQNQWVMFVNHVPPIKR